MAGTIAVQSPLAWDVRVTTGVTIYAAGKRGASPCARLPAAGLACGLQCSEEIMRDWRRSLSSWCVLALVLTLPFGMASRANAQGPNNDNPPVQGQPPQGQPATPAAPAAAVSDDDEGAPQPAEPDFRVVNMPTTLRLPVHGMNFGLTHRFAGNLREGGVGHQFDTLFGLDEGAIIGFEFRYAVARHLQAVVFRTNFDKTLQFYGKWDAIHQDASTPVSVSALVSVEGANNFRLRREPALGAVVSRNIEDRIALYATPMWVHDTAAEAGLDQDTFFVSLGGRVRVGLTTYLVAEVSPRLAGYAPAKPEYGFGIEKRVGGHVFQLNFTNTFSTTFAQVARGGFPDTLYLGFNLGRKFY
jgi:hypothetical protein